MAIVCRRRSTLHPLAGRSTAEDGGGATFLPREEWAKPRGRKSRRRRCSSGDRGAAVLRLDQAKERPWVARRTASSREVVANLKGPAQEIRQAGRSEGGRGVEKGRRYPKPTRLDDEPTTASVGCTEYTRLIEALSRAAFVPLLITSIHHPPSPTCLTMRMRRASSSLVVRPPADRRVSFPGALSVRRRVKQRHAREGRDASESGADNGECRLPAAGGHADAR